MSDRTFFVFDEQGNKYQAMNKEETLSAINQAIEQGVIRDIDAGFITNVETMTGGNLKFAVVTKNQYNALNNNNQIQADCLYIISNDGTLSSIEAEFSTLEDDMQSALTDITRITDKKTYVRDDSRWVAAVTDFNGVTNFEMRGLAVSISGMTSANRDYQVPVINLGECSPEQEIFIPCVVKYTGLSMYSDNDTLYADRVCKITTGGRIVLIEAIEFNGQTVNLSINTSWTNSSYFS